ncbi:hypothetical protein JCM10049v2_006215 [Rhodotorula toruloides]
MPAAAVPAQNASQDQPSLSDVPSEEETSREEDLLLLAGTRTADDGSAGRLPLELFRLVLEEVAGPLSEEVYTDASTPERRRRLSSAAIVCRAWSSIAQSVAWREIQPPPSKSGSRRLARRLREHPHLASHLRFLSLSALLYGSDTSSRMLERLLPLCSNLQDLTFIDSLPHCPTLGVLVSRDEPLHLHSLTVHLQGVAKGTDLVLVSDISPFLEKLDQLDEIATVDHFAWYPRFKTSTINTSVADTLLLQVTQFTQHADMQVAIPPDNQWLTTAVLPMLDPDTLLSLTLELSGSQVHTHSPLAGMEIPNFSPLRHFTNLQHLHIVAWHFNQTPPTLAYVLQIFNRHAHLQHLHFSLRTGHPWIFIPHSPNPLSLILGLLPPSIKDFSIACNAMSFGHETQDKSIPLIDPVLARLVSPTTPCVRVMMERGTAPRRLEDVTLRRLDTWYIDTSSIPRQPPISAYLTLICHQ